ncbi:MAG: long-chain fatty acid--CoA ligase [Candidatus Poribacteria bacterium]|nr:long-chain fatty acid--CoA ligase [Candidatus Poribacteria bacterium]
MNIGRCLTKSARIYPNNLAIAFGERRLSYAEFNGRVNRLANALHGRGIRKGDNVAVLMHNCPEMLESMYAGFKAGCGVVPINFRLHPKEYASIIMHSEAKAVIVSPEFNGEIIKTCAQLPCVQSIITLSGARDNLLNYESLLAAASDQFYDADVDAEDVAWIFYTSGTTGSPKGAMLTHRNLLAMTMNFYADMAPGFGKSDVALHAAPLSHGSGCYALPNIAKGAANVILESKSFDPEIALRTIQEHLVTNMFAAPTMIKRLIDSPAIDRYDHSSLKYLTYGGAPMLAEDLINAMEKLGPCLVQLYGQAESPMTITYLSHEDHVLDGGSDQMKRLASAGIPRTDVEVKVVDSDGNELPPGETGEIVTRSDLVMNGYWRAPEATAEALRDGWLFTGDMGYMDERGYLFLMDRSRDMIISGGENIYPREIEEVIVGHPAVREVAVIGIPDPEWGEEIKAVVALAPGSAATESELIDFCTEHIARYKKPRSVEFVDELPKNNYGKIFKR